MSAERLGRREPARLLSGAAALLAIALALGACGDSGEEMTIRTTTAPGSDRPAPELGESERRRLGAAERRIEAYCARFAAFRLGRAKAPSPAAFARAEDAAEELLGLVARNPDARIGESSDVRTAVGDVAESVEGANCDPRLESILDRGLAGLPAG